MSRKNLENKLPSAQSVGERLLILLKKNGPLQASEAGEHLGTTGEAARQQFVKLAKEGLVQAKSESKGVGRPIQQWHLTQSGHQQFPDTHAELTVQLLTTIRNELGESAIEKIISAREKESLQNYLNEMKNLNTLEDRIKKLVQIRSQEGYMAQYSQLADGSYLFIENHCPICAAATLCQGFCRAELRIFQQILETDVERIDYLLDGNRRCTYHIQQNNP